jgi:hypothetical protein
MRHLKDMDEKATWWAMDQAILLYFYWDGQLFLSEFFTFILP